MLLPETRLQLTDTVDRNMNWFFFSFECLLSKIHEASFCISLFITFDTNLYRTIQKQKFRFVNFILRYFPVQTLEFGYFFYSFVVLWFSTPSMHVQHKIQQKFLHQHLYIESQKLTNLVLQIRTKNFERNTSSTHFLFQFNSYGGELWTYLHCYHNKYECNYSGEEFLFCNKSNTSNK